MLNKKLKYLKTLEETKRLWERRLEEEKRIELILSPLNKKKSGWMDWMNWESKVWLEIFQKEKEKRDLLKRVVLWRKLEGREAKISKLGLKEGEGGVVERIEFWKRFKAESREKEKIELESWIIERKCRIIEWREVKSERSIQEGDWEAIIILYWKEELKEMKIAIPSIL